MTYDVKALAHAAVEQKVGALKSAVSPILDAVNSLQTRIEHIEAGGGRPAPTRNGEEKAASGPILTKADKEYVSPFMDWMRNPFDAVKIHRITEAQHEIKDVTTSSNIGGGYALPKEIDHAIARRVTILNPFRSLVYNPTASTTDFNTLVDIGDSTSGWTSETGTRSATSTPNLRNIKPTWGELYAYPVASNWSLEDLQFNVTQWLTNSAAEQFSVAETTAIVSGNGTSKPTGFLNTTPVTTDDDASPLRAAAALRYIPLGAYTSPDKINGDTLIDCVHSIKEKYLQDSGACAWVMSMTTLAKIRKLKETTGGYLFQPSLAADVPPTLLGYKLYTCGAMPAATSGLFPIAFGNWQQAYVLVDRPGTSITVDPYTTAGMTKFYVRRRVGGIVRNNDSLRVIKHAST